MYEIARDRNASAVVGGATLQALWQDPRRAIFDEGIVCLVCGRIFRHLTNTRLAHHGLTSEGYKQSFGYNGGRSLMGRAVRRRSGCRDARVDGTRGRCRRVTPADGS